MNRDNIAVLPAEGIITVADLSKFLRITDSVLVEQLHKNNVPFIKLSKYRRHWLVRLEDIRKEKEV